MHFLSGLLRLLLKSAMFTYYCVSRTGLLLVADSCICHTQIHPDTTVNYTECTAARMIAALMKPLCKVGKIAKTRLNNVHLCE